MKYQRFADLPVWQTAIELGREVYTLTEDLAFKSRHSLRDQIERASVSVSNNIAEGFERGSNKEFAQFLIISKGSAGEVRSALYAALDDQYITAAEFDNLREMALSVSRRCSKLITYLQRPPGGAGHPNNNT